MVGKVEINAALKYTNCIFIDVRSPFEFMEGTIPGAINLPLLDNEERIEIGKIYKKDGQELAKIRGLEIVSPKLPQYYQRLLELNRGNQEMIVFCARGGLRSATFVHFFKGMGLNILQLEGGFKAYRNYLLNYLEDLHRHHHFIVLHGFTGVGKTEILEKLKEKHVAVIDLEGLACNKGSVFGEIVQENPLTQKNFENCLLQTLLLTKEKYIIVESEGQRLGQVIIPKQVHELMKKGRHILISTSIEVRVGRLVEDYVNNTPNHKEILVRGIQLLKKRIGKEKVDYYLQKITEEDFSSVAKELILNYYDPLYKPSIQKYNYDLEVNYDKIEEAVNQIALNYHQIEGKFN
ncbi:tRNA 2-selenouridine(34) synthase MnmH [Alkaliphilus transvaalensis]|uniref:tRNA 2-selenouridine(34) synthase MnmH n=1 Tax=Alkaliphilus transvaalensis TaxID=114628 RepID=UPI00047BE3BA|nr:tRNA 2-selenouridine(34) synthase MnmH [Alkaliphilus transvaalensis]